MNSFVLCYKQFLIHLKEIEKYISITMSKKQILADIFLLTNNSEQKNYIKSIQELNNFTVQYNAIIISLYGCFENYINDIFSAYIDFIFNNCISIDSVSKKIKNKYANKIGEYLISPSKFSNYDFNTISVINNYLKFLKSDFNSIDKEFLLIRPGNLKFAQLINLLHDYDVIKDDSEIYKSELLKCFHINFEGLDEKSFKLKARRKKDDLFNNLDDLVQSRNQVAHSWSEDNRISTYNIINKVIPFLKCISEILLRAFLIKQYENNSTYLLQNKKPISIFNNKIYCINNQKKVFHINDYVILKNGNKYKCAKILDMEYDHTKITETTDIEEKDIGLELDIRVNNTDELLFCIYNRE